MMHHSFCRFAALAIAGIVGTFAFADATVTATGNFTTDWNNLQSAVNGGGTIKLLNASNGSYFKVKQPITISNGAKLIGGSPDRAVTISLATQDSADGSQSIIVINGSSGTVISNLTITAKDAKYGNTSYGAATGVVMDSGLLVDCLVTDVKTKNGGQKGSGIRVTGSGIVRRCRITRCEASSSAGNNAPGKAVYIGSGGTVECCEIVGNVATNPENNDNLKRGGAVFITGGTLRGCLIADNVCDKGGLGVSASGVDNQQTIIESCTIVRNKRFSSSSSAVGVMVWGSGVVLRNNIIWGSLASDNKAAPNYGFDNSGVEANTIIKYNNTMPKFSRLDSDGNISVDPQFVNPAAGNYRISFNYCVDAGLNQSWMNTATDLDGNPRLIAVAGTTATVDIGCYEMKKPTSLTCRMLVTSNGSLDMSRVTFDSSTVGGTASSATWTITRQQDPSAFTPVVLNGFNTFCNLPTGIYDVLLTVTGSSGSAQSMCTSALEVKASQAYVNKDGLGLYPYSSLENGSPTVEEAFSVVGPGGTLYVAEGIYVLADGIEMGDDTAARIEGMGGPEKTFLQLGKNDIFMSEGKYGLSVAGSKSVVTGLTLAGGRRGPCNPTGSEYGSRGLIRVSASGAVVTNCVFRDLQTLYTGNVGSGLDMKNGKIVDCLFTRIEGYSSGGAGVRGAVLNITGSSLAERLRVEECWMVAADGTDAPGCGDVVYVVDSAVLRNSFITRCSSNHAAPVYVGVNGSSNAGGLIESCTIVANTNSQFEAHDDTAKLTAHVHAVVQVNSGSMKNCIVADNWSVFGGAVSNIYINSSWKSGTWLSGSYTISYTLVDDRVGDPQWDPSPNTATGKNHNKAVEPEKVLFRNKARGDYSLRPSSPAVNQAFLESWMAEPAVDLDGNPRIIGGFPDLGCFEAPFSGFAVLWQ